MLINRNVIIFCAYEENQHFVMYSIVNVFDLMKLQANKMKEGTPQITEIISEEDSIAAASALSQGTHDHTKIDSKVNTVHCLIVHMIINLRNRKRNKLICQNPSDRFTG